MTLPLIDLLYPAVRPKLDGYGVQWGPEVETEDAIGVLMATRDGRPFFAAFSKDGLGLQLFLPALGSDASERAARVKQYLDAEGTGDEWFKDAEYAQAYAAKLRRGMGAAVALLLTLGLELPADLVSWVKDAMEGDGTPLHPKFADMIRELVALERKGV